MPIIRYKPEHTPCKLCGDGFDHRQLAAEPDLRECPTCGKTVARVSPASIALQRATRRPSVSEAKQAGFTVLKKIGQGEYEKQ